MNIENLQWNIDRLTNFYDNDKYVLKESDTDSYVRFIHAFTRILDINGAPNSGMSFLILDNENYLGAKGELIQKEYFNTVVHDGFNEVVDGIAYLSPKSMRASVDGYLFLIREKTKK